MANARIDRMVRELHTEPSLQFFERLFGLGAAAPKQRREASESAIPVSLLKNAPAR